MQAVDNLVSQAKLRVERARARYGPVDVAVRTFKRFSEDDGGSYSAALTYYLFFSIFPLLLFSGAVIGYLTFGNQSLREDLIENGLKAVPLLRDALTPSGLKLLESNRGTLAVTGLLLALYAGSGAVIALEHALNKIGRVEDEPNWVSKRLRSLGWLAVLGLAGLASLAMSALSTFSDSWFGGSVIAPVLAIVGGLAVGVLVFATAFKFLPKTDLEWSDVLPGAIAAAVAFEILKVAGSAYVAHGDAGRNATFGAFASAATLLVAAHLMAQITLLAAELNAVFAERRTTRRSSTPDQLIKRRG